jgi:deferrochelatase/peroxidase EfeB
LDPNQAWLKDGSFMAFRELQQLVPEFQAFCDDSAKKNEALNLSGDFIGARIVGRWKSGAILSFCHQPSECLIHVSSFSGAPLSLAPNEDNPELRVAQNFDYSDELKQERCPYAAHIRYNFFMR